jgi:hypothetical protein
MGRMRPILLAHAALRQPPRHAEAARSAGGSHSPTLPLSHSPTLPLSHSPTLPLSHSPTLPLSHSPTLPLSHSPTLCSLNLLSSNSPLLFLQPSRLAVARQLRARIACPSHNRQASRVSHSNEAKDAQQNIGPPPEAVLSHRLVVQQRLYPPLARHSINSPTCQQRETLTG